MDLYNRIKVLDDTWQVNEVSFNDTKHFECLLNFFFLYGMVSMRLGYYGCKQTRNKNIDLLLHEKGHPINSEGFFLNWNSS